MDKLIRPKDLCDKLGISMSTLYERLKEPDFPRRVQISKQAVGFRESELIEWMNRNTEQKGEPQEVTA